MVPDAVFCCDCRFELFLALFAESDIDVDFVLTSRLPFGLISELFDDLTWTGNDSGVAKSVKIFLTEEHV